MIKMPGWCRIAAVCCATAGLYAAPAGAQGTPDAVLVDAGASQLCVSTINNYRATLNLRPLARWVGGEQMAAADALADSRSGVPHSAIDAYYNTQEGMFTSIAQNECPGWPGPLSEVVTRCTADMWAEGPGQDYQAHGHFINMSNPASTEVACGFATAADGKLWLVQNLRPVDLQGTPAPSNPQSQTGQDQSQPMVTNSIPPNNAVTDQGTAQQAVQLCFDTINDYRRGAGLPPYARWPQGEQCAAREAAVYASGQAPSPQQDSCLANQAYGESYCASSAGTFGSTIKGCLQRGWNEGPGTDYNAHGDYLYMSSTSYHTAACGVARGADGVAHTVQIYK